MVATWWSKCAAGALAAASLCTSVSAQEDKPEVKQVEVTAEARLAESNGDAPKAVLGIVTVTEGEEVAREAEVEAEKAALAFASEYESFVNRLTHAHEALAEKANKAKYYIGVACEPTTPPLRSQLQIESGLIIGSIVADSPAAKANLREHDVLVSFNGAKLESVEALIDAVEQCGAREATLEIVRGGKRETMRLTPVERPKSESPDGREWKFKTFDKKLELNDVGPRGEKVRMAPPKLDLELMFVRPGVAVPADQLKGFEFPSDVSLLIQKKGDAPTQYEIKRGEKVWKVTEKELDQLPADIRALVEQHHGRAVSLRLPAPAGGADQEARIAWRTLTAPAMPPLRVHAYPAAPPATPVPPGVPSVAPIAPPAAGLKVVRLGEDGGAARQLAEINMKIDQVLRQVSDDRHVDRLQAEVDRLRREVEDLKRQVQRER